MTKDRGQTLIFIVALTLMLVCALVAVRVVYLTPPPSGTGSAAVHPGDDLLIDFTGRPGPLPVSWRVEGATDLVQRTPRGLLVVSTTCDDPPRLVLDLGVPEESFGLLEVTMALNKGISGRVWGSRFAGEPPVDGRWQRFALEPGTGVQTYRVALGSGDRRGASLHSLNIQLTDAPVRAVVRQVRLVRTAGWRSYLACGAGEDHMVVAGGIGVLARPAPRSGSLTIDVDVPSTRPTLHLSMLVHPLQQILGRSDTGFQVRVEAQEGEREPLLRRMVNPADPDQRRWQFIEADLSPWAGRQVRFHLETLSWQRKEGQSEKLLPGRPSWALPLWGPVSVSGVSAGAKPSPGIVMVLLDGVGQGELGRYGHPDGFPAVSRHFRRAAALENAYLAEYGRDRFLESVYRADYLAPGSEPAAGGLVDGLQRQGVRTAVFYSGDVAERLLGQEQLQAGFELVGRSDFQLGLPPSTGEDWDPDNPLLQLPGPLDWLHRLGNEPFFMVLHLDAGGSKALTRPQRLADIDLAVGRLMAHLERLGRLDRSVVCIAGLRCPVHEKRVDRGCRIWDEASLIPLLLKVPDPLSPIKTPDRLFRSIDIIPTLAGLAGLPLQLEGGAGQSLAPWLRGHGDGPWPVQEVFIHQQRVGRRYLGLRRGPLKLIWRVKPRSQPACYHLGDDPGEHADISPAARFNWPLHGASPLGRERYDDLLGRLESHFGP